MVTERYAHIMDDDRRINTSRMEKDFYQKDDISASKDENTSEETLKIVKALEQSPELMNMLKALLNK